MLTIPRKIVLKRIIKDKKKARADGDQDKQWNECTPRKCFRCGSIDHQIAKFTKPTKYNKKQKNKVRFNERGNSALQKESENCDDDNDQYIYVLMACMSGNDKSSGRDFGESLQLTYWIL